MINLEAYRRRLFFVAVFIAAAAVVTFGQTGGWSQNVSPLPSPTGYINDYAGVVDAATKQQLETKLTKLRNENGVEIAVAVVDTTGNRDIFDYSLAVARGWGVGLKQDDNPSALLLIAVNDRKYFTQVSRDLEDELPDGVVGSLQRQYLVPEFRKQNYAKGISDTIDAYIATIVAKQNGTTPPLPAPGSDSESSDVGVFDCVFFILVIIIVIFIFWPRGRGGRRGGGGWGGGGFGGGDSVIPWIIAAGSSNWGSSSSSDWGGSSDSGWGGFGGGGDFGGGGAGGDW